MRRSVTRDAKGERRSPSDEASPELMPFMRRDSMWAMGTLSN